MNESQSHWPSGLKKTKPRELVLSILKTADKPLSASDIYANIVEMHFTISLSTIYRILELLAKKNIVIKTTIMDNSISVYELNHYQHKHYAVCMNCHKVLAMNNCPMERFIPNLEDNDFHVMGHKVEVYGYCKECSEGK